MAETEIDGVTVRWIEAGEGPLAVLAHCSLARAGLWRPVMEALAPRWRVVALDMPGHGGTARGDESLSLQHQAARLVEGLTRRLGGGAPAHLAGLSLGAAVMGRTAHAAPDLAKSLTLIEPIYFHLIAEKAPEHAQDNADSMAPVVAAVAEGRFEDGARAFMEAWGQPGVFDRMGAEARAAVARSLSYLAPDFPMASEWPEGQITGADLSAIKAPVMLVEGARTRVSAHALQDELHRLMPTARREVVPEAGHLSPAENPGAVAALLDEFWTAAEAARPA